MFVERICRASRQLFKDTVTGFDTVSSVNQCVGFAAGLGQQLERRRNRIRLQQLEMFLVINHNVHSLTQVQMQRLGVSECTFE